MLKEKFETVRSFCNVGKTSATPASVPKQVQGTPQNNSDANKGKEGCNRGRGLSAAI